MQWKCQFLATTLRCAGSGICRGRGGGGGGGGMVSAFGAAWPCANRPLGPLFAQIYLHPPPLRPRTMANARASKWLAWYGMGLAYTLYNKVYIYTASFYSIFPLSGYHEDEGCTSTIVRCTVQYAFTVQYCIIMILYFSVFFGFVLF